MSRKKLALEGFMKYNAEVAWSGANGFVAGDGAGVGGRRTGQ